MENPQIQEIAKALRASGGRMTAQRRLIIETLANCTDHPTAEEIFKRASRENADLNLSTVYRTLRWLEHEGLVNTRLFEGEHRQERFDPVGEGDAEHYHFRCRNCNAIVEFPAPQVDTIKQQFEDEQDVIVESVSLTLYGLCSNCLTK
jgi:Fe2+ or Zn2+ uptake regulation protein